MEFSWHYNKTSRKPSPHDNVLICVIERHFKNVWYYIASWDAFDNVWVDNDLVEYHDAYVVSWSYIPFPAEDIEYYRKEESE